MISAINPINCIRVFHLSRPSRRCSRASCSSGGAWGGGMESMITRTGEECPSSRIVRSVAVSSSSDMDVSEFLNGAHGFDKNQADKKPKSQQRVYRRPEGSEEF